MSSTTIRVDARTHEKLRNLARAAHKPIGQVIVELIEKHERDLFWQQMDEDFSRLRADPEAWQGYQDELAEWDASLGDGLEQEPPYDDTPEERQGGDAESG